MPCPITVAYRNFANVSNIGMADIRNSSQTHTQTQSNTLQQNNHCDDEISTPVVHSKPRTEYAKDSAKGGAM
jgi:hypothetical protein